jgi:hypothetical protein
MQLRTTLAERECKEEMNRNRKLRIVLKPTRLHG